MSVLFFFYSPNPFSTLLYAEDLDVEWWWGSQPQRTEEENLGTDLTALFITNNPQIMALPGMGTTPQLIPRVETQVTQEEERQESRCATRKNIIVSDVLVKGSEGAQNYKKLKCGLDAGTI